MLGQTQNAQAFRHDVTHHICREQHRSRGTTIKDPTHLRRGHRLHPERDCGILGGGKGRLVRNIGQGESRPSADLLDPVHGHCAMSAETGASTEDRDDVVGLRVTRWQRERLETLLDHHFDRPDEIVEACVVEADDESGGDGD